MEVTVMLLTERYKDQIAALSPVTTGLSPTAPFPAGVLPRE